MPFPACLHPTLLSTTLSRPFSLSPLSTALHHSPLPCSTLPCPLPLSPSISNPPSAVTDVDECTATGGTRHRCQQDCVNTDGSYTCSCLPHRYRLAADGRGCEGQGSRQGSRHHGCGPVIMSSTRLWFHHHVIIISSLLVPSSSHHHKIIIFSCYHPSNDPVNCFFLLTQAPLASVLDTNFLCTFDFLPPERFVRWTRTPKRISSLVFPDIDECEEDLHVRLNAFPLLFSQT